MDSISRRNFLAASGALSLSGTAAGAVFTDTPTARENALPGTTDWQLTRVRINDGQYRTRLIEGYVSQQSYEAGDTIHFHVSTDPPRPFTIDIYRLGYYGGTGGRHITSLGPVDGQTQPTPEMQPENRLRECQWPSSAAVVVQDDWPSGVYVGKLTTVPANSGEPYWQSYTIFVVRDNRQADVIFQVSDNTWQAYNRWPVNESLYTDPRGAHAPGVAVSFDRPYGMYPQIMENPLSVGSGEFLLWEFPLCYWLEQAGYDVTYVCNADVLREGTVERGKAFLSVGHDEYWDIIQFQRVKQAIEAGVNVLWLGGNCVFVDSPFTASGSGMPLRTITRRGCFGPLRLEESETYPQIFNQLTSTAPDEREIMGVRSVVPFNGGGDWTCVRPEHWVFAGTGMQRGESVPGLVGWEHHGQPDPNIAGLEVLAEGQIWSGGDREGKYTSVLFPGPAGNFVFNASTIFWAQGLSSPPGHWVPYSHYSRPHGPDRRVQQMTHNVLTRAIDQRGA